jgi:hypothetical protein
VLTTAIQPSSVPVILDVGSCNFYGLEDPAVQEFLHILDGLISLENRFVLHMNRRKLSDLLDNLEDQGKAELADRLGTLKFNSILPGHLVDQGFDGLTILSVDPNVSFGNPTQRILTPSQFKEEFLSAPDDDSLIDPLQDASELQWNASLVEESDKKPDLVAYVLFFLLYCLGYTDGQTSPVGLIPWNRGSRSPGGRPDPQLSPGLGQQSDLVAENLPNQSSASIGIDLPDQEPLPDNDPPPTGGGVPRPKPPAPSSGPSPAFAVVASSDSSSAGSSDSASFSRSDSISPLGTDSLTGMVSDALWVSGVDSGAHYRTSAISDPITSPRTQSSPPLLTVWSPETQSLPDSVAQSLSASSSTQTDSSFPSQDTEPEATALSPSTPHSAPPATIAVITDPEPIVAVSLPGAEPSQLEPSLPPVDQSPVDLNKGLVTSSPPVIDSEPTLTPAIDPDPTPAPATEPVGSFSSVTGPEPPGDSLIPLSEEGEYQPVVTSPFTPIVEVNGVIDARTGGTAQRSVELVVSRDSAFDSTLGFYKIEDEQGTIRDPLTGYALQPGDSGYADLALSQRIASLDISPTFQSTHTQQIQLDWGLYASVLQVQPNTVAAQTFFTFGAANADRLSHTQQINGQGLGFEDLYGGGDRDYNDIVFQFKPLV